VNEEKQPPKKNSFSFLKFGKQKQNEGEKVI